VLRSRLAAPQHPAVGERQSVREPAVAIDWKQADDQDAFYTGDKTKNESYVDYGSEVIAVADGTVTATLDGQDANAPGVLPAQDPVLGPKLTVENVDGNHIVLDIGINTYAFYAHLIKGTLQVKVGDKVTKGQVIAQLGNTGNANASHMHFHLMNGPSVLGSSGLPYVIDSFDYQGQISAQQLYDADYYLTGTFFGTDRLPQPEPRTDQLPLAWSIVNFPGKDVTGPPAMAANGPRPTAGLDRVAGTDRPGGPRCRMFSPVTSRSRNGCRCAPFPDATAGRGRLVSVAPMQGDGRYNRNTTAQAVAGHRGVPLLVAAAAAVPVPSCPVTGALGPVVLADYGCSEGHNSLAPVQAAVDALRARTETACKSWCSTPICPATTTHPCSAPSDTTHTATDAQAFSRWRSAGRSSNNSHQPAR